MRTGLPQNMSGIWRGRGALNLCVFLFVFLIMQIASTCRALWRVEIRTKSSASMSSRWESGKSGTVRPIQDHSSTFSHGHCQLAPHLEARLPETRWVLRCSDRAEVRPDLHFLY